MRSPRLALLSGLAALATAGACGPGSVTLPEPPDAAGTAALVAVYEMPTAVIDATTVVQVATDAQARLGDLNLDWLPAVVIDALVRVRHRLADGGLPVDPKGIEDTSRPIIRAVATVHRVCAGWDDPSGPPNEAANGAIDLTGIVETGHIDPELWGPAVACKVRSPPASSIAAVGGPIVGTPVINGTVDGTIIVYALAPLPESAVDAQFLLRFEGMIGVDDQVHAVSFDFEYRAGSLSFRVPGPNGGDAIVTVGTTLGIRAANGGFSCDLTTATCQASS
jgi:hypothetical protein